MARRPRGDGALPPAPRPERQVAFRLGLSAEGVRKIESKALERLSRTRELEGLSEAA